LGVQEQYIGDTLRQYNCLNYQLFGENVLDIERVEWQKVN